MPQVVNTGKRENDYSAGMQMLSLAAERQSKKNQRQAILKNIMRSQGLNADVSEDGEIVFNDKKGENRISTQEAMDIGKVSTPESNLTRESEYNVESKINTDLTQDLVNMADQAMQNNQDTQAQAETKQAQRNAIQRIVNDGVSTSNVTASVSGVNSTNTNPNTSTNTPNTVSTADNQWHGLIAPRPVQNPVPPMDYPKPVTPQPVVSPSPSPKFQSNKDVKSQKNTYQTGYSTDRSVDVEIDPVVTTEGYKVQGMRDEVQEDMRDLQRKATIFSALNGLDPNAHNPYAKMAEQRATDLDFYNKNMVGVKQNMASATGGVKYKGSNKEDIKVAEGAQTQISTSNTTAIHNPSGPGPKEPPARHIRLANNDKIETRFDNNSGTFKFNKGNLDWIHILTSDKKLGSALVGIGYNRDDFDNAVHKSTSGKKYEVLQGSEGTKLVFRNGKLDMGETEMTEQFMITAGIQPYQDKIGALED